MNLFKLLFAVITALFLGSCAEPRFEKICEEGGQARPCSVRELAMIDDMQTIITTVRNFEQSNPEEINWFGRRKTKTGSPEVYFFGERHPEIIGRMQTLGAINSLITHKDILLLEGADWQSPHFRDCGVQVVFHIFLLWQFEKLGRSYTESFKWQKNIEYRQMFNVTRKSYDLTGLTIADLRCGYWDDAKAIENSLRDLTKISQYLPARNGAMVEAIKDGLKKYDRVFVNAGFAHLPTGDGFSFALRNRDYLKVNGPLSYGKFYRLVDEELQKPEAARVVKLDDGDGSTKVINDYLKKEKINFVEMTHGKMMNGGHLSLWQASIH